MPVKDGTGKTALAQKQSLLERIEEMSGQKVGRCFQCGKCTAGCPLAFAMDLPPARLHRLIVGGASDGEILSAEAIWLCASCSTCSVRCPNAIDTAAVMDALRQIAVLEGVRGSASDVQAFHRSFLDTVRFLGRTYEIGMIGLLKMRTLNLFQDVDLGIRMFLKGKLRLMPHRLHDMRRIAGMFKGGSGRGDGVKGR